MKEIIHLRIFAVVVLLLTGFCIYRSCTWTEQERKSHDRTNLYASVDELAKEFGVKEDLDRAFDKRLEQYKSLTDKQNTNLLYQALCIGIALMALFNVSDKIKVPNVDVELHINWVFWILPIILLSLWITFGFRLHELIDTRIALYNLANARSSIVVNSEGRVILKRMPSINSSEDEAANLKKARLLNQYAAVNDGGIMDGWFLSFRYGYTLEPNEISYRRGYQTVGGFAMALLGLLLGISNGTTIGLVLQGWKRIDPTFKPWKLLIPAYFWIAGIVLIVTHVIFWFGGQHLNWLQPVIAVIACAIAHACTQTGKTNPGVKFKRPPPVFYQSRKYIPRD